MIETGLAFSGGGIRSAAFSSGVLRRLLQCNTTIDYLSCVSGGGYTGSAYVDWKYRNDNIDHPTWHQEFFAHMRKWSGLMCNWQKPLHGVVDTLIILLLILFVCVLMLLILWGSYVFPVAYLIDSLFGDLLREEFHQPHRFLSITPSPSPREYGDHDARWRLEPNLTTVSFCFLSRQRYLFFSTF